MNLGADFIGVTLMFFVLRYFFLDDKSSVNFEDIKDTITNQILSDVSVYTPDKTYDSSQIAKKTFNYDITADICKSSFYYFRGTSAKYVPVRLRHSRNSLGQVRVIMLDPTSLPAIELRARDRAQNPLYAKKSISQLAAELREEIYMTVIDLFDCRYICPIDIIYDASGTSVYRLEILDQFAYISFYQSDESFSSTFPETVRYRKDTLYHNMYKLEIQRLLGVADKTFTTNKHSEENALRDHLWDIGCQLDDEALKSYRVRLEAFHKKSKDFTNVYSL